MKICRALNGTELAHAQHWTCDGSLQAYRIGHQCPDVRVRLQNERCAFNHGGIGALPALGQPLLDQTFRLRQQCDALAGIAFATRVVGETLAVRGLREEACQGVFADALRSAKKQRMRNAPGAQCAAQRSYNLRIAAKFREGHR